MIFAIVAKIDRDNIQKTTAQENIRDTSVSATTHTNIPYRGVPEKRNVQPAAVLTVQSTEASVPYRSDPTHADPVMQVKAAFAIDLDTMMDLYRFRVTERWPFASLTKLMASVIALEYIGGQKIVMLSESAIKTEGGSGNFSVGERYRVSDLVQAMMMVSSNDAAAALAEFYGTPQFVQAMEEKARSLAMRQTTFADPTGLSFLNQGSITDLQRLVTYILDKHPALFTMTTDRIDTISSVDATSTIKTLKNINYFAINDYPDFRGGKTGFTDEAGGNLVSIFAHEGHRLLIVVLGATDRFAQTEILYNWIKKEFRFNSQPTTDN